MSDPQAALNASRVADIPIVTIVRVMNALKAVGYAVVELPDPEVVEGDYGLYVSRAPHFGLPVGEEHDAGSRFRSIDETRRYAAALLAVADAAESAECAS